MAWLEAHGACDLHCDHTNRVVVPAELLASGRSWFGKGMFIVEIEPDRKSPYAAHVRYAMIRTTPPPEVRDLFRPSSCPIA